MLKKRIIFVLYYSQGCFFLSRNFSLQKIGTVDYLFQKFGFEEILLGLDELVILNVDREPSDEFFAAFESFVLKLLKRAFVPITLGGALRSRENVIRYFSLGCDKVLFNTSVFENRGLVDWTIKKFGSQAVVVNLDLRLLENKHFVYSNYGKTNEGKLDRVIESIKSIEYGELLLNSIDRDGTGFGPDLTIIDDLSVKQPVILCGGFGRPEHFDVLLRSNIDAVATGNIFNFIQGGLSVVREFNSNINIRR